MLFFFSLVNKPWQAHTGSQPCSPLKFQAKTIFQSLFLFMHVRACTHTQLNNNKEEDEEKGQEQCFRCVGSQDSLTSGDFLRKTGRDIKAPKLSGP